MSSIILSVVFNFACLQKINSIMMHHTVTNNKTIVILWKQSSHTPCATSTSCTPSVCTEDSFEVYRCLWRPLPILNVGLWAWAGVQLIGVANKIAVVVMLVGLIKLFQTQWKFFDKFMLTSHIHAEILRSGDFGVHDRAVCTCVMWIEGEWTTLETECHVKLSFVS